MFDLTILMPCLNEAETLAQCIEKAKAGLAKAEVSGEIVIADNGSTDGSIEIAQKHGARVVHVTEKGYGSALRGESPPRTAAGSSWAMPMTATISPTSPALSRSSRKATTS
ncbi:MAG: glycosyltransferase [Chthoniobacteraceae bacterium]